MTRKAANILIELAKTFTNSSGAPFGSQPNDGDILIEAQKALYDDLMATLPHSYPKDRFPSKDLSKSAAIGAMEMYQETKKVIAQYFGQEDV